MPAIEIPDGQTLEEVTLNVLSCMFFPGNRDRAIEHFVKRWLLADQRLHAAKNDDPIALPASWVKALVGGPSFDELEAEKALKLREGFTAGAVLVSMYVTAQLGKPITLNRAAHLVSRSKMAEADGRGALNLYGNKAEIIQAWKQMRTVAHLYAALILTEAVNTRSLAPASKAKLVRFLGLSNGILRWASSNRLRKPGDAAEPILNEEACWIVPEHQFGSQALVTLERAALPSWMTVAIDNYTNR